MWRTKATGKTLFLSQAPPRLWSLLPFNPSCLLSPACPVEVTRAEGNPATSLRMANCGRQVLWALGFLLLLGFSSAQGIWEAMLPARLAEKSRTEEVAATGSRQPHADRCPPPPRTLPPGACQATRCQADSECPRHRRCCYNGCAYACLEAVPPPPGKLSWGRGWRAGGPNADLERAELYLY